MAAERAAKLAAEIGEEIGEVRPTRRGGRSGGAAASEPQITVKDVTPEGDPPEKVPKASEKRSQSQAKIEKILAMDTKEAAEADLDAMLPRKRQRSVAPRRAGRSGGARSVAVVA